jgi:NAD kinase
VTASVPRLVLVTRKTPLETLLERQGTQRQAAFYLESRGQTMTWHEQVHARFQRGFAEVQAALPPDVRRAQVSRDQLDRFLFAPDDVILVVGQDGLVPNTAKYLTGQLTLGINPDPEHYDGVLCPHPPSAVPALLAWLIRRGPAYRIERRTMAAVEREDGQRLLALNEVFVGHASHQSARYRIGFGGREERHSSSGVICSTGTGCTGWARSIAGQRGITELPSADAQELAFFVREPFPSVSTQTSLDFGRIGPGGVLTLASEMGEDGTVFADGIEQDHLEFLDGHSIGIRIADEALNLVVPSHPR